MIDMLCQGASLSSRLIRKIQYNQGSVPKRQDRRSQHSQITTEDDAVFFLRIGLSQYFEEHHPHKFDIHSELKVYESNFLSADLVILKRSLGPYFCDSDYCVNTKAIIEVKYLNIWHGEGEKRVGVRIEECLKDLKKTVDLKAVSPRGVLGVAALFLEPVAYSDYKKSFPGFDQNWVNAINAIKRKGFKTFPDRAPEPFVLIYR